MYLTAGPSGPLVSAGWPTDWGPGPGPLPQLSVPTFRPPCSAPLLLGTAVEVSGPHSVPSRAS